MASLPVSGGRYCACAACATVAICGSCWSCGSHSRPALAVREQLDAAQRDILPLDREEAVGCQNDVHRGDLQADPGSCSHRLRLGYRTDDAEKLRG
jgi:hypothetical protein